MPCTACNLKVKLPAWLNCMFLGGNFSISKCTPLLRFVMHNRLWLKKPNSLLPCRRGNKTGPVAHSDTRMFHYSWRAFCSTSLQPVIFNLICKAGAFFSFGGQRRYCTSQSHLDETFISSLLPQQEFSWLFCCNWNCVLKSLGNALFMYYIDSDLIKTLDQLLLRLKGGGSDIQDFLFFI